MIELLQAELLELQGRSAEVDKAYRAILDRKDLAGPQMAIVANNLAFHLARPETAEEAKQLIDKAILELGPHPDLLDTRGVVRLAAGENKEALADLEEAALDPSPLKLLHLAAAQVATSSSPPPASRSTVPVSSASCPGSSRPQTRPATKPSKPPCPRAPARDVVPSNADHSTRPRRLRDCPYASRRTFAAAAPRPRLVVLCPTRALCAIHGCARLHSPLDRDTGEPEPPPLGTTGGGAGLPRTR